MTKFETEKEAVQDSESELQTLVELSDKTELVQCVRLMSVYLALYKNDYGELTPGLIDKIRNKEKEPEMIRLFDRGNREAIDILAMVLQSQGNSNFRDDITLN